MRRTAITVWIILLVCSGVFSRENSDLYTSSADDSLTCILLDGMDTTGRFQVFSLLGARDDKDYTRIFDWTWNLENKTLAEQLTSLLFSVNWNSSTDSFSRTAETNSAGIDRLFRNYGSLRDDILRSYLLLALPFAGQTAFHTAGVLRLWKDFVNNGREERISPREIDALTQALEFLAPKELMLIRTDAAWLYQHAENRRRVRALRSLLDAAQLRLKKTG